MSRIRLVALVLLLVVPVLPALPAAGTTEPIDLVFPQDPTVTEFTDSYGAPRAGHSHQGNDLMAPKMTEVYAVADGVVAWIRDRGSAGRYVAITHDGGWESWYMHLNDDTPGTDDGSAPIDLGVVVDEGERVEAGQLIGYVGDSGNAEGSSAHTHFELHHDGAPIDPYDLLVEAFDRAVVEALAASAADVRVR